LDLLSLIASITNPIKMTQLWLLASHCSNSYLPSADCLAETGSISTWISCLITV
jgi:hypothetical protein